MNKGVFDFVTEFPLAAIVICGLLVVVATLIYRLSKKDMSILEGKFSELSTKVDSTFCLIQKDISRIDEKLDNHVAESKADIKEIKTDIKRLLANQK